MSSILVEEWKSARARHGWAVGRYVIMEDHVHFFCRAELNAKQLSRFVQRWKEWTAKQILQKHPATAPIWQPEFFDHVLRSSESYSQKWAYVRENPVRAGLVQTSDDWHWQGEIENLIFLLHLESSVLADKFEFGFMEGIETQFEEIMITEAEGAGEQAADFSVDALHFSAGEPCFVVAQVHPWHGEARLPPWLGVAGCRWLLP